MKFGRPILPLVEDRLDVLRWDVGENCLVAGGNDEAGWEESLQSGDVAADVVRRAEDEQTLRVDAPDERNPSAEIGRDPRSAFMFLAAA